MFHVQIELLDHPLLEIQVLRLNGPGEILRVRRCRESRQEAALHATVLRVCRINISHRAETREIIRFREVWRIFPQPLRPLVPRRIVEDCVSRPDRCRLASHRFPGKPNPGFKGGLIKLDAHSSVGVYAIGATVQAGTRSRH